MAFAACPNADALGPADAAQGHFHPKGTAKVDGDVGILKQLASTMVTFEVGFEILPGTKRPTPKSEQNPFEVGPIEVNGE